MGAPEKPRPDAIRVLIADASRILCELLTAALQRSQPCLHAFAHVGQAGTLKVTLANYKPQVAVIGIDGEGERRARFELLREFRMHCPHVPAIALIDCRNRDLVVESFRGGAKGVFSRSDSFSDLCKCIL